MARLIRADSIDRILTEKGHHRSEFIDGNWDPGIRVAQAGRRQAHVFWDGPGESDQLEVITVELRAADYHVVPTQQDRGGRRRLEVTRP
ncbi:hypothetical protein OG352_05480 [Streptomyces sp. NBC_01485]|uniref:hypothetical protein n=1 Tax=Streptomyces sp. NBC_01485 TaxID=2903884 RepID=UPI002E2F4CC9|nr:hypothetical protein [Streptomyces sp. NBC_01485]